MNLFVNQSDFWDASATSKEFSHPLDHDCRFPMTASGLCC